MKPLILIAATLALSVPAFAQDKADGRQQPVRRKLEQRQLPQRPTVTPRATSSVYVDTSPEYRHIQIRQRGASTKTKLDVRDLTRVMTIPSLDVYRFEQPRISQVETVIRLLDSGDRDRAIRTWGGFVASLRDRVDPIDLDNLMIYIARESCFGRNPAARFHAQRLAHLRQSQDDARFYLAQCEANLRNLSRFPQNGDIRNELEIELARTAADLQIFEIRERQALLNYNNIRSRNDRYERDYISLYDQLHSEACLRVQLQRRPIIRRP